MEFLFGLSKVERSIVLSTDHWHEFKIGRSGFAISATINIKKKRAGVELYMHRDPLKHGIRTLEQQKAEIEAEVGEGLEWQELTGKKASRVALYRHGIDPSDEGNFVDLHGWMLDKMQRFRKAFAGRVRVLNLDEDIERMEALS